MKTSIKISISIFRYTLLVCLLSFFREGWAQTDKQPDAKNSVDKKSKAANDSLTAKINVAYGEQLFSSLTSSISVVNGQELRKTPAASVSNTLFGRLPGLTVMQRAGEPGYDSPSMLIRGKGTYNNTGFLVLVDGFEASGDQSYFDQMSVDEIENVAVLKDAAALALYGIRGANGAILVTTKRGVEGKSRITFNARKGFQEALRTPSFLSSFDYARLYNEALVNDGLVPQYSEAALDAYKNGRDPYLYPNVNWYKEALRDNAPFSDYSLTFSGGGKAARYFVLMGLMDNQGLYANTDEDRKINSNASFKRYNFRTNIDMSISKNISASMDIGGRVEDRYYPNISAASLWDDMARIPSNAYPVRNPNGTWGGNSVYPSNPVASILAGGLKSTHDRNLNATFRLAEDLNFITPGLKLSQAVSFNNWHRGGYNKTKSYRTFELATMATDDGRDSLTYISHGTESDLAVDQSSNDQWNRTNVQVTLSYDKTLDNHSLKGMLMYHQDVLTVSGNNVPYARQSIMGRLNYGYKSRYYAELDFSYSGSESFPAGHRFGFFPALSGAWIISEEDFLKDSRMVDFLKLRASVGLIGSDRMVGNRFAYQQDFYYSGSYNFGVNNSSQNVIAEGTVGNKDITWEKSLKYNLGLDGKIFKTLDFTADLFYERRHDILSISDGSVPAYIGISSPYLNYGKVNNHGFELNLNYNNKIGGLVYYAGVGAFYSKNKIVEMNEVTRAESYLYRTGHSVGKPFGLEAIGFFKDEADISNSPVQTFSPVQPGDIKYKDQNNDGFVNENDAVPLGLASEPELTYTMKIGGNYKGFDLELFFHGIANRDVYLSGTYFWALVNNNNIGPNALNRWTPATSATADYPRLTSQPNANNYRSSSFWMKSGAALRLRNIELGYTLPKNALQKIRVTNTRIFVSGINLFTWDKIKTVDPESLGGYPPLKSYNLGLRVQF